jgi:hypothetical protein
VIIQFFLTKDWNFKDIWDIFPNYGLSDPIAAFINDDPIAIRLVARVKERNLA